MNTSSKTPGLFRRLTYKIPIFRSLKAYIFLLMLIIGIVPSDIMRLGILNNYEERAVNLRGSDVASQYRIIANHLVNYNYLQNPTSDVVNAELEQMSNLYDGRVLIINSNFRIVKDTYAMSEGKTMISEEVLPRGKYDPLRQDERLYRDDGSDYGDGRRGKRADEHRARRDSGQCIDGQHCDDAGHPEPESPDSGNRDGNYHYRHRLFLLAHPDYAL